VHPHLGILRRYGEFLPINEATPAISLGEGDTPLVASTRLVHELGCRALYFKLEGCNPTGSFKDRGMVLAIAKAIEEGSRAVLCASTGNTSAAAAAYAARANIEAVVLVPASYVALGKLAQARHRHPRASAHCRRASPAEYNRKPSRDRASRSRRS
jgi:threonine synthase